MMGEASEAVAALYRGFARGEVGRRDFMKRAAALGVAVSASASIDLLAAQPSAAQVSAAAGAAAEAMPVDLAEWSYFWLGVTPAKLARGTIANGEQMYVEYWTPAQVKHPYPIVIVHGGGGQGLDWLGLGDGSPGWVRHLLADGWKVYLVDRPGHGRAPFAPESMGGWPAQIAATYDLYQRVGTAPEKTAEPYGPQAKLHTQWPGTGVIGDPVLDQVMASQGGAFLTDLAATHAIWKKRGAELLDRIGPAVVMAHSAGGPTLWLYADARPGLVKALVGVEPAGPPFTAGMDWGLTAAPVAYDPPIADASELKLADVPARGGRAAGRLQAEPARRLKNLAGVPIVIVTAEASYHWAYEVHTVGYLRQAGCEVDHIELEKAGVPGHGHYIMQERDSPGVLRPILQWLDAKVSAPGRKAGARQGPSRSADPTALALADMGFFWVGVDRKAMPYGTIPAGQMYVQYLVPAQASRRAPVVLAHSRFGQGLTYMGPGGGLAGWAHYYVRQGRTVYLLDLPGMGRSPYHPDALGPSTPVPTYEAIGAELRRAGHGGRWPGTGQVGDPGLDQLMAAQGPALLDNARALALWRSRGAALLDRIGPAVIQTHSDGAPFGWLLAAERPSLVKAVAAFEGTHPPPAITLPSVPMACFTAAASGRSDGPAVVAALNAAGGRAEHVALADHGVGGNGRFAMLETNRRQVFDLVSAWVDKAAG